MIITPSKALDMIVEESKKVVAEESIGLKASLVIAAPVDTGNFKAGWQIKKINDLHFQIYNPVEYSSILWGGYRNVNGVNRGSRQWMDGGDPLLAKTDNNITRRLDKIKH